MSAMNSMCEEVDRLKQQVAEYRDTIAQQAERIKELEAAWRAEQVRHEMKDNRIKELEAERDGWREDANISRNSIAMLKDRCNHLEDTLAALRQRIDDAPVVATVVLNYNIKHECYDPDGIHNRIEWNTPREENKMMIPVGTKLISKGDLL